MAFIKIGYSDKVYTLGFGALGFGEEGGALGCGSVKVNLRFRGGDLVFPNYGSDVKEILTFPPMMTILEFSEVRFPVDNLRMALFLSAVLQSTVYTGQN